MHPIASRRRVLTLGVGFAASAWLPALGQEKTGTPGLITRPIPHSGERLPVIGLGTSQVFEVGDDPARRKACAEVLKTLVAGGGTLIDTAPSYGTAEGVVGDLLAATGLNGRVFLATKLEDFDRALADYDAALKVNPTRARARALYGRGLAKQGKRDISGAYDLAAALEAEPGIADEFAGYGVK